MSKAMRLIIVLGLVLTLTACAGMNSQQQRILSGGAIGAGAGAALGAVAGAPALGAAVGGAAGIVGGILVDEYERRY